MNLLEHLQCKINTDKDPCLFEVSNKIDCKFYDEKTRVHKCPKIHSLREYKFYKDINKYYDKKDSKKD